MNNNQSKRLDNCDTTRTSDGRLLEKNILHYRLIDLIGSGGMGDVFLAQDTKLDRLVALKLIAQKLTGREDAKARLFSEARTAAKLNHPNICSIHAVEEANESLFIAMEYVDGQTLNHLVTNQRIESDILTNIAIECCEGLNAAHEENIIHRDIKPANIMLNSKNRIKIMDFGIAKQSSQSESEEVSDFAGTLKYMSPEQITGKALDFRSDIFSMGVVFYQLSTGEHPFGGDNRIQITNSIANDTPKTIELFRQDLPAQWSQIVTKMLEKDVSQRYQDVSSIIKDLNQLPRTKQRSQLLVRSVTSLAVFPLRNNSGNAELDYLADGITEELITKLSKLKNISVASRSAVFRFKEDDSNYFVAAEKLQMGNFVEGTLRLYGEKIRINIEVVNVEDQSVFYSEVFDRQLTDILELQADIAEKLAVALNIELTDVDEIQIVGQPTSNKQAYDLYLQGRYFLKKRDTESIKKAIQILSNVIELDDEFAAAHAELAVAFGIAGNYGIDHSESLSKKAYSLAEKSIDLDPGSSFAHMSLFFVLRYENIRKTISELKTAIALDPSNYEAHHYLAHASVLAGNYNEAAHLERSALRLDPFQEISRAHLCRIYFFLDDLENEENELREMTICGCSGVIIDSTKGWLNWCRGKYEAAIVFLEKALKENPNNVYNLLYLADAHIRTNALEKAKQVLESGLSENKNQSMLCAKLGQVLQMMNQGDEAQKLFESAHESIEQSNYANHSETSAIYLYNKAWTFSHENRLRESLEHITKAAELGFGNYIELAYRPDWDNLRTYQPFKDFLSKLKSEVDSNQTHV